jgi:hypothetical protein
MSKPYVNRLYLRCSEGSNVCAMSTGLRTLPVPQYQVTETKDRRIVRNEILNPPLVEIRMEPQRNALRSYEIWQHDNPPVSVLSLPARSRDVVSVSPAQSGKTPACVNKWPAESYAVARARWRRCFALSLALRLLARIVLLALAVFFTRGSDLRDIGPFLVGIVIRGHRLLPRPAPAT